MDKEVKFKVEADVEQAKKDLRSVNDVEIKPELNDSDITGGLSRIIEMTKAVVNMPRTMMFGADTSDFQSAVDYTAHAIEFLNQKDVDIQFQMSDLLPQELFYVVQELTNRINEMNEALGDKRVSVRWQGEKIAVKDFEASIQSLQTHLGQAQRMLDMRGGFTPPDLSKPITEVGMLNDKLNETGTRGQNAGNAMSNGFLRAGLNLRRLMFGMLGVQSMYSILSMASRQYVNENEAMKASMTGVTQAIGNLMAPAIGVLISALQTLIRWTMIAIAYITTFINVIFGTNIAIKTTITAQNQASKGFGKMGKSAKKSAKDIKKAYEGIAGIDELNVINSPKDASSPAGGGASMGGGGLGGMVAPDMSPYDITNHLEPMRKFAEWLEKHRDLIKVITVFVLGLVAAWAGLKVITFIIGIVEKFFALAMANPWVIVIAGIIAVIYLLWQNWDTIMEWMALAGEWLGDKLNSIVEGVKTFFSNALAFMKGVFDGFIEFLGNVWNAVWDGIKLYFTTIWNGIVAVWELGKLAWEVITTFLKDVWDKAWNGIKIFFIGIWNWIKDAWNKGKELFSQVVQSIKDNWRQAWENIKQFFSNTWNWIKDKANALGTIFSDVWNGAKENFKKAFEGIKSIFSNVWNWILKQFKKGGEIFGGFVGSVADVFKTIVNHILRGVNKVIAFPFNSINKMLNKFSGISILGVKPFGFIGHNPMPVPQIPEFANGTVSKRRQLGWFGEYTGAQHNPEYTTPEKQLKALIDESNEEHGGGDGGDLHVTINVPGDKPITKTIKDYNKYKREGGDLEFA